jgi:hypothetical protein
MKPFAAPDHPTISTCWDCGHTWPKGTDGTHSCVEVLQARLALAYILPHIPRPGTDVCALCQKPMDQVAPGGCPATLRQIWSRAGDMGDEGQRLEEEGGRDVEARAYGELQKRLRRLHEVLQRDLAPALPAGRGDHA